MRDYGFSLRCWFGWHKWVPRSWGDYLDCDRCGKGRLA